MKKEFNANVFVDLEEIKDHLNIKEDEKKYDNRLVRLANMATAMVETHIRGPVLLCEKTDIQDGSSSNVLVPHFFPVRRIVSLAIDYNGDFTNETTIINPSQYGIRGYYQDVKYGIRGSDVYIRNDGNLSIVGRIFVGSVVQSIKMVYEAGRALSKDDVPEDLRYATILLIEYFYTLRENRELGVKSKGNIGGQNYSRELGIPQEIQKMLEPYVDYTFGAANRPQRNTMVT
jgi:hypothetical protein